MASRATVDAPTLIAFTLPTQPEAVRIARLYVRAILWFQGLDHYADDAETITSELVTNVIQHVCDDGTDKLVVTLKHVSDAVALCVSDSSSTGPVMCKPTEGSEQGRGLLIVEELSHAWKWELSHDGGKDVIAILARDAEPKPCGQSVLPVREHEGQSAVIGANIRALRQRKGWSQARLADLMGWHCASTVCAAEGHRNGRKRAFTTWEVRRLAAIFGVPPRQLKTACGNCNGHPPTGFSCLACGVASSDRSSATTAPHAPMRSAQGGHVPICR